MKNRHLLQRAAVFFLGLMVLLGGCMSAPIPNSTTAPWIPPDRAQQSAATWQETRARYLADFSEPLTLADLAEIALQNNPATRRAWNEARTAKAQVEQARGYFLPTLTATLAATRLGVTANPKDFDRDDFQYGPGLQLNYMVLNFGGGRAAAVEQALQTVYAANFMFNSAIQDVLLAVEIAYYRLISAQSGVEAAETAVKDAQLSLETAQERVTAGSGTILDTLQAQAGYDQAQYTLASMKGQLKVAYGNLAQTLGLSADTSLEVEQPMVDVPAVLPARDIQALVDETLERRPDIAALRARLAAKQAAIRVAGSQLWPSLYLAGALNQASYNIYDDRNFQDDEWSYNVGLNLQWMLFDGQRSLGAKRAAAAQAAAAQAELEQAEIAASADLWAQHANYETALEKYRFSAAYLTSATASYNLALDSYRNGLKSMLDLVSAESQLEEARYQNIAARQEAFSALANLAHAMGLLAKEDIPQAQELYLTRNQKDDQ